MHTVVSGLVGLIFGLGLILSGMADPAKVLGFLDLAGAWDPSLALVMVGAIAVGAVGFALARRRSTSWLGLLMNVPTSRVIDSRLIAGSLAFGVGWGLAGFCPGPALVGLGMGQPKAVVFVLAMLVGMGLFEVIEWARAERRTALEEVKP
ncbi:MAG: hypothetical protein RIS44_89 [Pseudomonadota bacterium]|jgi:uncharacterized membrane protein YedE/YeeE